MRIALDVKNLSRVKSPTKNDVIIYDGERWYVTTKDEILKDASSLIEKCEETLKLLEKENAEFKSKVSADILEIANTTKELLKLKEGEGI